MISQFLENNLWARSIQLESASNRFTSFITLFTMKYHTSHTNFIISPPRVDHLDVVERLIPSMNGNQEFTAPRSLERQAGPLHWDVCSCCRDLIFMISLLPPILSLYQALVSFLLTLPEGKPGRRIPLPYPLPISDQNLLLINKDRPSAGY
jgi:hypothetical protein